MMPLIDGEYLTKRGTWEGGLDKIEHILPIIEGKGFIGGSYAAWLAGSPVVPNDVDIFAISADAALEIADLLASTRRYQVREFNGLAYSFQPGWFHDENTPVQVVVPNPEWKEFPADIIASFDFDVSSAILLDRDTVLAHINIGCKEAKILRIANPLRTLKRVVKYQKRGMEFNDWELLKVMRAWALMGPERQQKSIDDAKAAVEVDMSSDSEWVGDDDYFEGE